MSNPIKHTSQAIDNWTFDETMQAKVVEQVDPDGSYQYADPLSRYKITDIDDDYFGFTDRSGGWYIMFDNVGSWKYLKGDSGYTTAWTNRVGAGYDYFYNIF